jgi:hypothetical protein
MNNNNITEQDEDEQSSQDTSDKGIPHQHPQSNRQDTINELLNEKIDENVPRNIDPQLIANIEASKTISPNTRNSLLSSLLEAKCEDPHKVLQNFVQLNEDILKLKEQEAADLENYLKFLKDKPIIIDDVKYGIELLLNKAPPAMNMKYDIEKLKEYLLNDDYLITTTSAALEKIYRKIPKPVQIATRFSWHLIKAYNPGNSQINFSSSNINAEIDEESTAAAESINKVRH